MSGYVCFLCGDPISWQSRTQPTTVISLMESKYMAAHTATQVVFWLKYLFKELGANIKSPIDMFKDDLRV